MVELLWRLLDRRRARPAAIGWSKEAIDSRMADDRVSARSFVVNGDRATQERQRRISALMLAAARFRFSEPGEASQHSSEKMRAAVAGTRCSGNDVCRHTRLPMWARRTPAL